MGLANGPLIDTDSWSHDASNGLSHPGPVMLLAFVEASRT
jgi:hypothetical protein